MRLNSTSNAYMAPPLVAYMSVNDLTEGQGWKARATMFVQLMAPRYTLLPIVHPSLRPLLRLLELAAGDLPAVGRLAGSAVSPAVAGALGSGMLQLCKPATAVEVACPGIVKLLQYIGSAACSIISWVAGRSCTCQNNPASCHRCCASR